MSERARKSFAQLRAQIALPLILSIDLFSPQRLLDAQDEGHQGHDHLLADGFESVSFESERHFAAEAFQLFLEQLPANVFRAKGVLAIAGSDKRYIFHLVSQRFTLDESHWTDPIRNKLVLIGRGLDARHLRKRLHECLATDVVSKPLPDDVQSKPEKVCFPIRTL